MEAQERYAWLQMALTPYVGAETFLRLLRHFGSAQAALAADKAAVRPLLSRTQALHAWRGEASQRAADAALAWEARFTDARLLLLADADFPPLLSEGLTPPVVLFARGDITCLPRPAVAIVGSRHATPQAQRIARDFATALAQKNIVVVSGMADGIDTAAHEGTLRGGGQTVAVWGTGIDRVYPARNKPLAEHIAAQGCLLSEFPLGTRPLAANFPRRNRLIAALCQATLVVEAAVASGSLITARLAGEMGREVMAVPGSIDNALSKGCHALIKQGAKLVENLDDILQECPPLLQFATLQPFAAAHRAEASLITAPAAGSTGASAALTDTQQTLLQAMNYDAIHPDELVTILGMTAADVYAELLALELDGWVSALSGGRFQRIKS